MNIIFMGTPQFALPTFAKLLNSGHRVVAVFTQRPKPKGRGMQETKSPVQLMAEEHGIPVHTPSTLRNLESFELISSIEADVIVVVAYGFIIPKSILDSKKYGCLNIHPSKLPKYRGAAPLQRTIMNGDSETAVCIMQMDEGLDTGDIILRKTLPLSPTVTLPELHDTLAEIGADLLLEALEDIDRLPRIRQASTDVSYAAKLTREESKINWYEPATVIERKIRGTNPWPGTFFEYQGKTFKVLEADCFDKEHEATPGEVISQGLEVACGHGVLAIKKIQQAGKKALYTEEFLRGTPIPVGCKLE